MIGGAPLEVIDLVSSDDEVMGQGKCSFVLYHCRLPYMFPFQDLWSIGMPTKHQWHPAQLHSCHVAGADHRNQMPRVRASRGESRGKGGGMQQRLSGSRGQRVVDLAGNNGTVGDLICISFLIRTYPTWYLTQI